MIAAAKNINQMYGSLTNTFHAIQFARLVLCFFYIYNILLIWRCFIMSFVDHDKTRTLKTTSFFVLSLQSGGFQVD